MAFTVALISTQGITTIYGKSGKLYLADGNGIITVTNADDLGPFLANGWVLATGQTGALLRNNLIATTDPGVSNDITQDYGPGSIWLNTSASRVWMCLSNAAGAATWLLDGVVPGVGVEPSSMLTFFGAGTNTFLEEGNLNRQIGNPLAQPATTGNDSVLAQFTLSASSFDIAGRGIQVTGQGSFAATVNSKRCKLFWNATIASGNVTAGSLIADTGASTASGVGWSLYGNVFKYGAAGSNTQYLQGCPIVGATHGGINVPVFATATESGSIIIALTGNATTATTDISATFFEVNAMN